MSEFHIRQRRPSTGSPPGSMPGREQVAMDVGVGHPLRVLDRRELAGLRDPARGFEVVEDRLVAREALVAHHLLDEQAAAAVGGGVAVAELGVALGRDLAEAHVAHQRFPRLSCSRSIASNSALKLPSPKPLRAVALDHLQEDRRPVADRLGEDLEQVALVVAVGEDAQLARGRRGPRRSRRSARAAPRSSSPASSRKRTPRSRSSRTVATMSVVASAMCWAPGPP